ncbi:MAG: pseudouridine synthase [Candidatus Sericytochromatia bacterium]|nr:pseudouridine synthase [Candidatus Sericytochromatia bacterium]
MKPPRYYLAYKPFGVLTQFSGDDPAQTLQILQAELPRDVYPVGRLDKDSEGLLLLSSDKRLNQRLLDPRHGHWREYYVQVEGQPTSKALAKLAQGVPLKDGLTRPAQAALIPEPALPPRDPPIRYRASIPASWISLSLTEGRNRQVRRMTAAVGFPTLRLVRWRIQELVLGALQPGMVRELTSDERQQLLLQTGLRQAR